MYGRVFEGHAEGALILQDLVARFYDVNVFVRGGPDGARETDRRAARREVVHFILNMIGQVKEPPADDDSQPAA
jgi:hypothetical protein